MSTHTIVVKRVKRLQSFNIFQVIAAAQFPEGEGTWIRVMCQSHSRCYTHQCTPINSCLSCNCSFVCETYRVTSMSSIQSSWPDCSSAVILEAGSIFLACVNLSLTEQAYSAAENKGSGPKSGSSSTPRSVREFPKDIISGLQFPFYLFCVLLAWERSVECCTKVH